MLHQQFCEKNMGQKQMCGVQALLSSFNSVEFHHFGLKLSKGFCEQVLKSELDYVSDPWPKIAETAKDLLRRTLNPNAAKRLKAHQVLCHPWICEDGVAPDRPSDSAVQTRLKNFSAMNKLKKMAIRVMQNLCPRKKLQD
jgi:calcium-dependent protein kinase